MLTLTASIVSTIGDLVVKNKHTMKRIDTKVLFHPSMNGALMTNPQGKTNAQKYFEALDVLAKLKEKNETLDAKLKIQISEINSLEDEKENEVPARKNAKSPAEKYRLAVANRTKTQQDVFEISEKINEQEIKITELEKVKDIPTLSATCKKLLKSMAIDIRYHRKKRIDNKYTKKGTIQEDASIEIYSDFKGESYENNKQRMQNDYFTGEWDIEIRNAQNEIEEVADIKTRFDIDTFEDNRDEEMQTKEEWQLLGYCDLLGSNKATIANVLTNTHYEGILDEIRRETYNVKADNLEGFDVPMHRVLEIAKDNIFDTESYHKFISDYYSPSLLEGLKGNFTALAISDEARAEFKTFVEVPLMERVIEVTVERDDEKIQAMKERIEDCRKWLEEKYNIFHV